MIVTIILWAIAVLIITLIAIPFAVTETIIWAVAVAITIALCYLFDVITWPFKWFYRKLYPKKKENNHE